MAPSTENDRQNWALKSSLTRTTIEMGAREPNQTTAINHQNGRENGSALPNRSMAGSNLAVKADVGQNLSMIATLAASFVSGRLGCFTLGNPWR